MKRIHLLTSIACLHFAYSSLIGAKTDSETFGSWDKWRQGTFENISYCYPGEGLTLGKQLLPFTDLNAAIIWKAKVDTKGRLLVATGGDSGALWEVDATGKTNLLYETNKAFIRALDVAQDGAIYFATSPNGNLYRLKDGKEATIFAEFPGLFIWDILIGADNSLYIATGTPARIYKLPAQYQKGAKMDIVLEAPDQSAFTNLARENNDLYAGAGNSGLVYKVDSQGNIYVVANAGEEEITAILPQKDGSFFLSTFREKAPEPTNPIEAIVAAIQKANTSAAAAAKHPKTGSGEEDYEPESECLPVPTDKNAFGALYRVDKSGFMEAQWGVLNAGIFALANTQEGAFLVGTSSNGKLGLVKNAQSWEMLAQSPTGGAITAIVENPKGGHYVCTSNPARIFTLSATIAETGTYTSAVIDAEQMAIWGSVIKLTSPLKAAADLQLQTRSGNIQDPDKTWSPWMPSKWNERIAAPSARYLQYKVIWPSSQAGSLSSIRFFYTYPNMAPSIQNVTINSVGVQINIEDKMQTKPIELKTFLQEDGLDKMVDTAETRQITMRATGEMGFMTAAWKASDPNGDSLLFSVALQAVGNDTWAILAKDLDSPVYSFNTRGLAEGYYRIKVTADDSLSNSPQTSLKGSFITAPFTIDTKSPSISIIETKRNGSKATITFIVEDSLSPINNAYFAIDGNIPSHISPTDGLFDGLRKTFVIELKDLMPGIHSIVIEAEDDQGNSALQTLQL